METKKRNLHQFAVMKKAGRSSTGFAEIGWSHADSMVPEMAEVASAKSASIDGHGIEVRGRVRYRVDMIAMRHVVDVRRRMWNEHASRVNSPVSCMRYQMAVCRRVRHRIYVVPVSKVVDVRGRMRYRVVVRLGNEYLSRSRLDSGENSECNQTKEDVSHNNAPS